MSVSLTNDTIVAKTEELCQAILDHPVYLELIHMIDTFFSNQDAMAQYELLVGKQRTLQEREQSGALISTEEIEQFKEEQYQLLQNDVIRQFLFAQKQFEDVHNEISERIIKTVELGRIPTDADLKKGSCGCGNEGGCSCGGH